MSETLSKRLLSQLAAERRENARRYWALKAQAASPSGAIDPPRETSKSNTFSPEQKERAFDLIQPDHAPALEIEEIDELRRRHRMTSKSNGKPEGGK